MIEFCDLSHWNTETQFIDALNAEKRVIALKVTEGETFKDKCFSSRVKKCGSDCIIIAYHFLRADRNYDRPHAEMENYLKALKAEKRPFVMALDFERPYCNNNERDYVFLIKCVSYLLTKTGKEPYIYINESQLRLLENKGFKVSWLWVAKWGNVKPQRDFGIWQYTNKPLDTNYFVSDNLDLLKRHEVEL